MTSQVRSPTTGLPQQCWIKSSSLLAHSDTQQRCEACFQSHALRRGERPRVQSSQKNLVRVQTHLQAATSLPACAVSPEWMLTFRCYTEPLFIHKRSSRRRIPLRRSRDEFFIVRMARRMIYAADPMLLIWINFPTGCHYNRAQLYQETRHRQIWSMRWHWQSCAGLSSRWTGALQDHRRLIRFYLCSGLVY